MMCVLCGASMVPVTSAAGVVLMHLWEVERLAAVLDDAA